ncbi:hypothetical protein HYW43_00630 [Candidatus Daviesbacteria bacterium]|nr:hypothetical protein [Candidatus Daviesbacteria bacterium]
MKKFLFSNIFFVVGFLLTLSLLWPLFIAPYFTHHDDVQVIRLYEMNNCIKDGQIPCRWVPNLGGLYGYPIFNYYAPLPYYFGELIYLLTNNLLISVKVMFAVSFIGSYIFMYLFASKIWGKTGGALSAVFYSFAPYHALDFYIRGAMGEMWALMLLPAVLWGAVKLEEKLSLGNLLLFGVFIAAAILAHNLSAMIFLPIIILWTILLFFKRMNYRFLWFSLSSFILGLVLSAFYLLPMLAEKSLVHVDTTTSGYFSFTEHFKGFRKLFLDRSWEYGSSIREIPGGERDKLSYQVGWVHLLGWLLAGIAAFSLWRRNKWMSTVVIVFSVLASMSIFLIHPRSEFIWKAIEPLKYLQFPWRFLLFVIFFISLLSGSLFKLNFRYKNVLWGILVFMVVVLNFSYFRPEKFIQTDDRKLLSGKDWDKQIKRSIFDYLPIYAKEPPAELATERYQILTGDSRIYDYKEGTNWITFKTETRSHTIVRLSQYYFPNWKVFVDGKETMVEYKNNSLGLITFILGKGNHEIVARLYDTPIRSAANLITLAGITVSAVLFLISFEKVRKGIRYYSKRMH